MGNEADLVKEITILRDRLDQREAEVAELSATLKHVNEVLNRSMGAVTESTLKVYAVMTRLLAANDVKHDAAMRVNVLEHMNDLGRNIIDFFYNAGLVAYHSKEAWPPRFGKR